MVKDSKARITITLPKKVIKDLEVLQEKYDLPLSTLIHLMIVEKLQERKIG